MSNNNGNNRNVREQEKNVEDIYEFDELVLAYPDNRHFGYSEQDVMVKIRDAVTKSGKNVRQVRIFKDGKCIARTNAKGEVLFTEEYLHDVAQRDKDRQIDLDKRQIELTEPEVVRQYEEQERRREGREKTENKKKDNEIENSEKRLSKEEQEEIEESLGDEYSVIAEISDAETSAKLCELERYVGNPYIVRNVKTGELRIAGKDQYGEMQISDYQKGFPEQKEVTKMNRDGTQTKEVVVASMIYIGTSKEEAISLEINGSGTVSVNKVVNPRSENAVAIPIDTKQTDPTTLEVDEMKKDAEVMGEVMDKLDQMEEDELITSEEKEELLEDISSNGDSLEEDLEKLEELEKKKRQEKEKEETTIDDDDDDFHPRRGPFDPPPGW